MRAFVITTLLCLIASSQVNAGTLHAGRASARVADSATGAFRCLIGKLLGVGYHIDFMGGYRSGHCATASKHPCGTALDINQTARNRVTRRLPPNTNSMARSCGLFHGAEWRHADAGHFEVLSTYQKRGRKRK